MGSSNDLRIVFSYKGASLKILFHKARLRFYSIGLPHFNLFSIFTRIENSSNFPQFLLKNFFRQPRALHSFHHVDLRKNLSLDNFFSSKSTGHEFKYLNEYLGQVLHSDWSKTVHMEVFKAFKDWHLELAKITTKQAC